MEENPSQFDPRFFEQAVQENEELKNNQNQLNQALQSSSFFSQQEDNLIQYQLSPDSILERVEHFLRGDQAITDTDEEGNIIGSYWRVPKDKELRNLNDYGVTEVMRIISMYVNKETILSFYDEDRMNEILADLGDELNKFFYCNYEKIGLDTEYKKTKYIVIILNILHIVESTYRRALGGEEREGLRTRSLVTQNQPLGMGMGNYPRGMMPKKRFNLLKPSTW